MTKFMSSHMTDMDFLSEKMQNREISNALNKTDFTCLHLLDLKKSLSKNEI